MSGSASANSAKQTLQSALISQRCRTVSVIVLELLHNLELEILASCLTLKPKSARFLHPTMDFLGESA